MKISTEYLKRDCSILIVDDVKENLKLLADTLMCEGYQVRPALSGRMAIDSAWRRPPDLVLLDIRMPEMDGFSVCRRLKSDPRTADIPVIFISALEDLGDKIEAFNAGGVDYITKPFQEQEILSRVKTHLALHTLHRNLEAMIRQRTGELETTNRALRLISHSNRLLVHVKSETDLLAAFCDSLIHMGGYPFCWIGYPRDGHRPSCDPIHCAPPERRDLAALAHLEGDSETSPSSMAAKADKDVCINDLDHESDASSPWRRQAVACGLHACLSLPLFVEEATIGTLTVYAGQNSFFDPPETALLNELAENLALGIHMIRERIRREQAEIALKESEKRLHQAQKMEALGTLASGIAHDFRNILYPIIGYSELALAHTEADSVNRRRLSDILGCAKHANELVNQILAFSRQSKPELRTLMLSPVIEEALEPFRTFLPDAIALQLAIDSTCGLVRADPTHIHQIVINLATNAIHAMEETGGSLRISLHRETLDAADLLNDQMHPGPHIRLSVADTGTGIDPAIMDKLFDPYFSTREKGKGTGLGLSVVHGIVTGYNGGVRARNRTGQGARFDVYLPASEPNGTADTPRPVSELPKGTERILVVDDEPQSMKLLHENLSLLGYRVAGYGNGPSALEAFRAAPDRYDLVMTDYAMPEMSGTQLAEALLAIRPEIPIILCTAHSERLDGGNAPTAGIRQCLKKPLLRDQLAHTVRNTLDAAAAGGASLR